MLLWLLDYSIPFVLNIDTLCCSMKGLKIWEITILKKWELNYVK